MKTSELTGIALDWAVELAKGTHWSVHGYFVFKYANGTTRTFERKPEWRYSTDWSQGGPIIERERLNLRASGAGDWVASTHDVQHPDRVIQYAPTPLIAAMRCYVASKFGDEIEVPEEYESTRP